MKSIYLSVFVLFLFSCKKELVLPTSFVRPVNNTFTPAVMVDTTWVEIPEFSFEIVPEKAYQVQISLAFLPQIYPGWVEFTARVDTENPDCNIFLHGVSTNVGVSTYPMQVPKTSFYLPARFEYDHGASYIVQTYTGYIENYSGATTVRFFIRSANRVTLESSRKMFVNIH